MPATWFPHGVGLTDDEIKSHGPPKMHPVGPFHPRMLEGVGLSVPCEVQDGRVVRVRTPTRLAARTPETQYAPATARPVRTIVLNSAR